MSGCVDTFWEVDETNGFISYSCGCTVGCALEADGWSRDADTIHTLCSDHVTAAVAEAYGLRKWGRL